MSQRIVLGVTGSIAAYKACSLLRLLSDRGHQVRVVMSESACKLIQPITFQALSGHPVCHDKQTSISSDGMDHIALSQWCNQVIIAPCSANFMAKLAHGIANDELSALALACNKPISIAPAMNAMMWKNPATMNNRQILLDRGINVIDPVAGRQACGSDGIGNMCSPEHLIEQILHQNQRLKGLRVLVTAGATQEQIDPIRYISNHSSGQMGYAIAKAFCNQGAQVTLISGPCALTPPSLCQCINVISAKQMHDAVNQYIKKSKIFIAAAAVSDYRPQQQFQEKIKKNKDDLKMILRPNPDILSETIGINPDCIRVGFALESNNLIANALLKKQRKKLDFIIANLAQDSLNSSQTTAHIIGPGDQQIDSHEMLSKQTFAIRLTKRLTNYLENELNSCVL